ncbi:O-antigen ligase family protein [Hymenobacter sp. GOD-10R]|uniref:O-antigen ligase family protein n=1 Tax=Hymenobacter sp. GOD-10R TaxID=3093922 RepID=UPI002D77692A|nr:O-antigen ligase family protein [Hymenobacter sp. GOD-10R]WRQ28799.1 O-antigen ligase family protein [Hymenobacter sp. GOD-10R]
MKIRLDFLRILPMLAVFCTCSVFWEFLYGSMVDQEPEQLKYLNYALLGGGLACVILFWRYMQPIVKKWFLAWVCVIVWLVLESYAGWNSWLVYPHVFNKFFVLLITFGLYAFHRRYGMPPFSQLINVLVLVLMANLLILHRDSLSLNAFVENERGFNSSSAYLLVIVALFFLNRFLLRNSFTALLIFFVCMPLIVFLQHRSVWIATIIAVPVDLLLLRLAKTTRFSPAKMILLIGLPAILGSLGLTMIVLNNPEVVSRFEQSIDDIANADKQGTGSWRLKQIESYIPLVQKRPIAGWRLEGFDVPMQFYDPSSDAPMWPDHTGHHFHNFYLDRAFYFGILGILLVLLVPFISVGRRLLKSRRMDSDTAALVAYFGSLIVFGTSYDWSTYHFGLLGLIMAAVAEPVPAPPALDPAVPFMPEPEAQPSALIPA